MKNLLLLFLALSATTLFSQTIEEIDTASDEICEYLSTLDYVENDEIKLDIIYRNKFTDFSENLPEDKVEEAQKKLYYRLQRNCVLFQKLLIRLDPPKDDVELTTEKPKSKLSKKELKSFKNTEYFSYLEVAGDRTNVTIKNGFWQDNFADNTYSKLNFKWIGTNEFELEFIESNNETRSNLSVPGDKYIYEIIEKTKDYYLLCVNVEGQDMYQVFKMYYE